MRLPNRLLRWGNKKNFEGAAGLYLNTVGLFQNEINDQDVYLIVQLLGAEKAAELLRNKTISPDAKNVLSAFNPSLGLAPCTPKKIAVCLSGDMRSFVNCKEKIKRFFDGHDVIYFCHLWHDESSIDALTELGNYQVTQEYRPDFTEMEQQSIQAFGLKTYNNDKKIPFMSPNLFPMWYGILKAFQSIEVKGYAIDDFDLICRCRYDNYFLGQLNQLSDDDIAKDSLVIDSNYNGYGGYGDQFAVGSPDAIKQYCSLYLWFDNAFRQFRGAPDFFPEVVIKKYLDSLGIRVKQMNFGLRLLRDEFVGLVDHKIPLRCHKASKLRNDRVSDYIKTKFPDLYST